METSRHHIDLSGRSVKLSRREVRALLREVTVFCCGCAGEMNLKRSLELLGKCVREAGAAPVLVALIEFSRLKGGWNGLEEKAELAGDQATRKKSEEADLWDAL
jgi:hypothetical protein